MTFGVGQRKERKLCPKPLRALRIPRRVVLRSGSTFHGETALRLLPLLKECVALLVARTTCNEGVPAHKELNKYNNHMKCGTIYVTAVDHTNKILLTLAISRRRKSKKIGTLWGRRLSHKHLQRYVLMSSVFSLSRLI